MLFLVCDRVPILMHLITVALDIDVHLALMYCDLHLILTLTNLNISLLPGVTLLT